MQKAKDILLKILETIDYSDDKDAFADEFLQNVSLQALLDLFNTLPQDKKDQIQQQITNAGSNPQAVEVILKSYFTESQIRDGLQNASKKAVTDYMKAIDPTLSEAQRENLIDVFRELNQNNSPSAKNS